MLLKQNVDFQEFAHLAHRVILQRRSSTHGECAICLRNMHKLTVKHTPCRHTYHARCLNKWLQRDQRCPLCRTYLETLTYDPQEFRQLMYDGEQFQGN